MSKLRPEPKPQDDEAQQSQQALDDEIAAEAQPIWKFLKESRRRAELEWFINEEAHDNNQFLQYNTATKSLQAVSTEKARDKVKINRVKQQTRSIVSFLNQRKPFVQALPGTQSDTSYISARKTKSLCDDWYRRLQMNKKNKKISKNGVVRGLGWSKIAWSNEALAPTTPFTYKGAKRTKQYGDVTYDHCDTFDIYPDPMASEKTDLRFIAHSVPRSIGDLKKNTRYRNTEKLSADSKLSSSDLKEAQLRHTFGSSQASGKGAGGDLQTTLVVELFYWKWNEPKKAWWPYVVTMSDGGVILCHEWWEIDEFPFEPFIADITGAMLQSKGIVSDIRDPNRAVNDLVSQTLESARTMGKLNWIMPRNANVNVITDQTGQFIEYDMTPGGAPKQAQPAGVPTYIPNLISYLDSSIMDVGGAHDSSMGKNVFAGASGELVQSLQAGDASSMAMLRDNFDDYLVRCFNLMLKTANHFGKAKRVVRSSDADDLGQYSWTELEPKDISTEDDIVVKSGSNLPYTSEQRQEFFISLFKANIITDPNALLKLLDIPDIINVLGDDELDIQRELNNIRLVTDGKEIKEPNVSERHDIHIQTLDKFIRSERFETLKPEQQNTLTDHRDKHSAMASDQAKAAAMNQYEPIKRSESVSLNVKDMNNATPIERGQMFQQFNMNSDAALIQARGGLVVQDPADAEQQAQNEDIDLMDGKPVPISLGDNHQVHIETHSQILASPHAEALPPNVLSVIKSHIAAHEAAITALMPSPGLVPPETAPEGNQPAEQPPQPQ